MPLTLEKAVIISMQGHKEWTESFVQDAIARDTSLLGLGSLALIEKERRQTGAGRLDLLLANEAGDVRYEVEIQLGKTDPSHIFRTIEYWDIERKRDPGITHIAVIVAEEVESRFFNVISLLNQTIPIIAIKMSAVQLGQSSSLLFIKVLDHTQRPTKRSVDLGPSIDRQEWERRSSKAAMKAVDELSMIIRGFIPEAELSYKRPYIGLRINNRANNFATFRPQKKVLKVRIFAEQAKELDDDLDVSGLDYEFVRSGYVLRLTEGDIAAQRDLLAKLLRRAYDSPGDSTLDETPEADLEEYEHA